MQSLVEVLAKALVDNPSLVQVKQAEKDKSIIIELKVADSDMGKILGRQGRIAKAIRTLVKAAATKTGKRIIVEITK